MRLLHALCITNFHSIMLYGILLWRTSLKLIQYLYNKITCKSYKISARRLLLDKNSREFKCMCVNIFCLFRKNRDVQSLNKKNKNNLSMHISRLHRIIKYFVGVYSYIGFLKLFEINL